MKFTKMHGTGNDFIFLLDLNNEYVGQEESLAKSFVIEDLELEQMG